MAALTAALAWVVQGLPGQTPGLAEAAHARLDDSGVSNPVTAVLLNFRAYDTLLEIGVLLLAVVAVWALAKADNSGNEPVQPFVAGATKGCTAREGACLAPQQTALVNLLAPLMLVTAGYLLWIGASAPGGAFQAGAVLGGAGVLLVLSRPAWAAAGEGRWLRAGLVAGLAVFLAVGLALLISGRRLLEYPAGWAGGLILVIETAAAISIGLTLTLLFLGGRPAAGHPVSPRRDTNEQSAAKPRPP